jgi:hypothetical protein
MAAGRAGDGEAGHPGAFARSARAVIHALIGAGIAGSIGASIYAARPWGGNYAYQDASGYLQLLLWEGFIALPYVLLYLVARRYGAGARQLAVLLFSCLLLSGFGVYAYVDAVLFSTSSTSALIFLVLPVYQVLVVAGIWGACAMIRRREVRGAGGVVRPNSH